MKTALFLLSLLFISETWAGLRCESVLKAVPLRDSSVEIEISGTILDRLFTTSDGTIGPVIHPLTSAAIPPALLRQLQESFPGEELKSIPWDVLSLKEKADLVMSAAKARKQNFFSDRTVHGLKYRDQFELVFKEPSEFMGKMYAAGRHRFNSQDIFANTKIEFSGPKGMEGELGLEIHLRRADGADKNLISSTRLQKSLVGFASSVHQHVVAPIPLEALAANPEVVAYQIMDLYRRVSLHAQLLRVTRGHAIEELKASAGGHEYVNMPLLEKSDLKLLHNYFLKLGSYLKNEALKAEKQRIKNEGTWREKIELYAKAFFNSNERVKKFLNNPLETSLAEKSGLIGMRAGKVYDGDVPLWGMEFRDLAPSHEQKHLGDFLKAIQTRMLIGDYGLKDSTVMTVINDKAGGDLFDRIYYPSVRNSKILKNVTGEYLDSQRNEALGMLLHNWEKDPMFIENPQFLPKLADARKIALESIKHGGHPTEALTRFAKRSGLHYLVWQSLKIE